MLATGLLYIAFTIRDAEFNLWTLQGLVLAALEIASHTVNTPHSKMTLLMGPRLGFGGTKGTDPSSP